MTMDLNGNIDAMYTDLSGKIEALSTRQQMLETHVKKLDTQVAQTVKAVKRQENTLPGKTDANPRYACNAIMLNADISAEEFEEIDEKFLAMLSEEIEDEDVELPEQVSINTTHQYRSTPAAMDDTNSSPGVSVDRHPSQIDPEIDKTPKIVEELVYKPIPPYPRACKPYDALVENISWQLHRKSRSWQFPEVHEFRDLPCVKKVIDKAYAEEICLNDAVDLIYLECSAILKSRLPEKLPDPVDIPTPSLRKLPKVIDLGRFVVPCSIFGIDFKDALCDSGSTVNLMSLDVAHSLGITALKKSQISFKIVDSSTKTPEG